jgi:hypothetical protein
MRIAQQLYEGVEIADEQSAVVILDAIKDGEFKVETVKKGTKARQPAPPFNTSTMQQAASRKFGYDGKCYTSYAALRQSLHTVREWVEHQPGATIAIPYLMSCHRGGGNWDTVLQIITEELGDLNVTLWEYNGG